MANFADQKVKTCPSGSHKCVSSKSVSVGDSYMTKRKSCAVDCNIGSININNVRTLSVCCNTDCCNAQDAPGTYKDGLRVVKGCVSKSICDAFTTRVSKVVMCCEGNLCNGAQSVTQSFRFLCCSLLSYFLMT